ncbi:hypothetical protein DSECCO2_636810 [anaerobic digester metagenome]
MLVSPGFFHWNQVVFTAGAIVSSIIDPLAQEHYMGKLWTIPIVIGMLQEITDGLCRDNPKIKLVINILKIHYLYYVTFAFPESFQLQRTLRLHKPIRADHDHIGSIHRILQVGRDIQAQGFRRFLSVLFHCIIPDSLGTYAILKTHGPGCSPIDIERFYLHIAKHTGANLVNGNIRAGKALYVELEESTRSVGRFLKLDVIAIRLVFSPILQLDVIQ